RGLADERPERDVEPGDAHDHPEVTGIVVPLDVQVRLREQQPEPEHRQRQMEHPDDPANGLCRGGKMRRWGWHARIILAPSSLPIRPFTGITLPDGVK